MATPIERYASQAALNALCQRYHVRRLELFGSTATGSAGADSDLDLIVDFDPLPPDQYADHYFGLRGALAELFGRPVDLVMASAIKNPYFAASVNASRVVVYAS